MLELCALAALAVGGAHVSIVLAVAAPLLAAAVWGQFVSPKAAGRVSEPVRWAIETAVFLAAAAALVVAGSPVPAIVFAVVALLNGAAVRTLEAGA